MPTKALAETVTCQALAQRSLEQALAAAQAYVGKSRADATWRAYQNDWRQFEAWCLAVAQPSLPATADVITMFVAAQAAEGRSPATLNRRLAAIRLVHLGAGHASPHNALAVAEVMRGIRRDWGKPPARKTAAIDEDLKRMVDAVPPQSRRGLRDRAVLLFGFAGALRRAELVRLDTAHLEDHREGLRVTIARSKTDQEAQGQVIAILRQPDSKYCPVQALKDWLVVAEIEQGALFRRLFRGDQVATSRLSPQSVALIVKQYAARAGLDPRNYAGHSLRSGFLTSAAAKRANIFKMADQSRHKSLDVLRAYVRAEALFEDNAGAQLLRDEPGAE